MSLTDIIKTASRDIDIYVRTNEQDLDYTCYYDYIGNDGKSQDNCMNFYVTRQTKRHKFDMYITSIKYADDQKNCPKSGTELIKWAYNLRKKGLVKTIKLEDASEYTLPKSDVTVGLTRFSKFTSGRGWYENYGFISPNTQENKQYQKSFITFRNNNTQNLTLFLWHLIKPFLLYNGKKQKFSILVSEEVFKSYYRKYKNDLSYSYSKLKGDTSSRLDYASLKKIAMRLGVEYGNDLCIDLVINFLEKHGVSPLEGEDMNESQLKWFDTFFSKKPANSNCILKALTPGNIRKLMQKTLNDGSENPDTLAHIKLVDLILEMMQELNVLFIPRFLITPNTRRTYKKSLKRCVSSSKK